MEKENDARRLKEQLEKEIDEEIDKILEEDEDLNRKHEDEDEEEEEDEETSSENCDRLDIPERNKIECLRNGWCCCKNTVGNLTRFSVCLMEAMKYLQRSNENSRITSTIEEIINFIDKNYQYDGDLYSQVKTTLKQICSQGFAIEIKGNEYYLIGPSAHLMEKNLKKRLEEDENCNCEEEIEKDFQGLKRKNETSERENPRTNNNGCLKNKRYKYNMNNEARNVSFDLSMSPRNEGSISINRSFDRRNQGSIENFPRNSISCTGNRCSFDVNRVTGSGNREAKETNSGSVEIMNAEPMERNHRERKKIHERDVKRWIRRCQRECVERAREKK